ncbi:Sulfotransferase family cytosolic 1B member 1 [Eumeta japonica]|uniref:Sulfotransferase family cytosolic 1B member 1 n=1 Tax=Eumeta variegata TaxID=151549 RepID=A0A4C1UPW9_EUMVA|nr:Sulfotransferase family cytosolic 1B member 1 [Eumeta japonica]
MAAKVQVQDLEAEAAEILLKRFPEVTVKSLVVVNRDGHSYYGEHKYLLPTPYKEHADGLRDMPLRDDDIWVASFPRSGTTWTQELTWLINNDLDYDRAAASLITERYVFIE